MSRCGRDHPGPCAWVGKGGPLEPICLQPERVTGPTLSNDEEDELIRAFYEPGSSCAHNVAPGLAAVERILAAHLNPEESRDD